MRILFFGDSITHGVFDSKGGWATRITCDQFMEQLDKLDEDVPYAYNLGFSGDTTRHLAERLPAETEARYSLWSGDQKIVFVIAVGVNDSHERQGKPVSSPEQYAKDLVAVYDAARRYSDKVLFVGMAPMQHKPWADQYYRNERIWEFEEVQRRFVKEKLLPFVPLYELFQERLGKGEELLAPDGLHPNDVGHQLIYEQVKPALGELLKK